MVGGSQERANAGAMSIAHLLCFSLPANCPSAISLTSQPPEPSFLSIFSLCFSVFLSPAPPLPPGFSGFFLERSRPGHSSEGCGNESAAPHEESSSALVMRRKENSSRELMRPPRTKEATSRGQRGGAQLSRPAEPQ